MPRRQGPRGSGHGRERETVVALQYPLRHVLERNLEGEKAHRVVTLTY